MTKYLDLPEPQQNRLMSAYFGMLRVQKAKLRGMLAHGRPVLVTSDSQIRFQAAEDLVELGFAKVVRRGPRRVAKGPMPADGRRRLREEILLAPVEAPASDDERI